MGDTMHVQNQGNWFKIMGNLSSLPSIFLWTFNCSLKKKSWKNLYHLFGPHVLQNNGISIFIYKVLNNRISLKRLYFFLFFLDSLWRKNCWHLKDLSTWWYWHRHKFASAIKFTKMAFQCNLFCEEWATLNISLNGLSGPSTFHSNLTLQMRSLKMGLVGWTCYQAIGNLL